MNSFRYKHSIAVYVMLFLILCFSAVGIYFNIISAISEVDVVYKLISYTVLGIICLLLFLSVLSIVFFSRYVVKNGLLVCRLGIISVKHDLNEVKEVVHVVKNDKLVIHFGEGSFAVIVIEKNNYEHFVDAIKKVNPQIKYDKDLSGFEEK